MQREHPFGGWSVEWDVAGQRSRIDLSRPLRIGREAGCDVVLNDPTVSRVHAIVTVSGGQILVDASGSTNGITIERGRADRVTLAPGQPFKIGSAIFRVVRETTSSSAPAASAVLGGPVRPGPNPASLPVAQGSMGTRRNPLLFVGVAVIVVVLVAALAAMIAMTATSSPTAVSWSVPKGSIPSDAPREVSAALGSFQPPEPVVGSGYVVETVQYEGDWAVAVGHAVASASGQTTPTETIVVVAHRTDSGWNTVSDRDPSFCSTLTRVPVSLLSEGARAYYVGCN